MEAINNPDIIQPFALDPNFDYDNITLTPRFVPIHTNHFSEVEKEVKEQIEEKEEIDTESIPD